MTWAPTNPANSSALNSAVIRQMWEAIAKGWGQVNLIQDPYPIIWHAGDTANDDRFTVGDTTREPPAHWNLTGTGAKVERSATGLTSTTVLFPQASAVKVFGGGAAVGVYYQDVLTTSEYDSYFDGITFTLKAQVWCGSGSAARIWIDDGTGKQYSSYHTGSGSQEELYVTYALNGSATKLQAGIDVAASTNAVVSGWELFVGEVLSTAFMLPLVRKGTIRLGRKGLLATATDVDRFEFDEPGIVHDVFLALSTVNTGAAMIVDVNQWDGSAWNSMFGGTKPQISASASPAFGQRAPDGTYRYRCFGGCLRDDTNDIGRIINFDIDQVGSTVEGNDLRVNIRTLQFVSPLRDFLSAIA